jgi:radical SAM protein with 4Fe4S-binding SPASM domain
MKRKVDGMMEGQGYVIKKNIHMDGLFKRKQPRLSRLDIELTERCNNNCIHCYINLPAQDARALRNELRTDQWKDILQQAADLGFLSVRFTGGEPLLREDFAEIYLYARRLGMKVILFTNARLITPDLADLFARVPPLMKIEISNYGMRAESYNAVARTQDAFSEFLQGVKLLWDRKIPVMVKYVLLPPNKTEMTEFESLAAKIPGMEMDPSFVTFLDLRTRRDSPAKNRLITSLRISPEKSVALLSRNGDKYRKGMAQFCTEFMYPQGDILFTCGAGETGCVDAYGKYQMCMILRHPDMVVDLKQLTMHEALTDVFPRYRELRATNPEYLKRCARCFLKGLCEQCPAKSWAEHGTLDTPVEYFCQVAHAQARVLGILEKNENAWEITDWHARINRLSYSDSKVHKFVNMENIHH